MGHGLLARVPPVAGYYPWTLLVATAGVGLLLAVAMFIAVVRISGVMLAGIYPEAWVMVVMMTAPFTIGSVALLTLITALAETLRRRSIRA
ncbi:MAG: hypothetical protein F4W95_07245 [Chloroflexi bacterium]|nr:hypothetical protein [Chloroflexota bacterium]MYD48266.1 hypothetical protein [Chloroflexota bacterium]